MKIKRMTRAASLLIAGLGLAITAQTNASLQFNGSSSKAVLDGNYLDGATHSDYTFEVWIKPFALGGTLIGKMEYWKAWTLDTMSDGGMLLTGSWPNYYWGAEVAAGSLTTNVWQHVCCAVAAGQASFYLNGSLVGTETVQNPISFNASTNIGMMPPYGCDGVMCIGYSDSGTTPDYNFFNGLIYGIKVWSRTLSAGEVMAIATTGIPLSTNGLYNSVMLDEASGTTIHDSLTGLTGRVLTAQWNSDTPPVQSHCSPHAARATAVLYGSFVVDATITDGGCGYTNPPLVLIQGGGGSGATATATISNGVVTAIHITNTGSGYTSVPTIVIASPPFAPTVSISVSKVKVTQHVTLGRTYVLESSPDLRTWTPTGPQFTADSETIVSEFDVAVTGRYFRIRQVP